MVMDAREEKFGDEERGAQSVAVVQNGVELDTDEGLLAKLGYKQEFRRNFHFFEVGGIAVSCISLLASIASTLSFSIPGGPAAMVWGWAIAGGCIFVVSLALADMASAMPTSGGLYFWTHYFAPPKIRNALCFLVGYSNTLGLIAGICSVDYGFALQLVAVLAIASDGTWTPPYGLVYGIFLACVVVHGTVATTMARHMGRIQSWTVLVNLVLVLGTIVAIPAGTARQSGAVGGGGGSSSSSSSSTAVPSLNSASYIFGGVENLTTWSTGWAFVLAWLSPIWTISCFDSCVHMAEEAANAAVAVPWGMVAATASSWVLGFAVLIAMCAGIDPDLGNVLNTSLGQPMAQIYLDALGKSGALGFMALLLVTQFFMGLSILVACSRQSWAFCRDGALPFSSFFRVVTDVFGWRIPLRTIWGCVGLAAVLGLLCLIATAAANALFSLLIVGNNVAYMVPLLCRALWGGAKFVPGRFYTGRASLAIAWFSVAFLAFGVVLAMFPDGGPGPSAQSMNYAVVISVPVWAGALLYYFVDAHKWFTGPRHTIDDEEPMVIDGCCAPPGSVPAGPLENVKSG